MASTRSSKRMRTDGGSSSGGGEDVDDTLRLCPDLASLVGRKYVKQSELSREAMVSYLQSTGAVKSVELVRVKVEQFGGDEFDVVVDDTTNKVCDLKKAIQEEQGTKSFHQALFLLRRGGEAVKASEDPLADSIVVYDGDRMALCVTGDESECLFVLCVSIFYIAFSSACSRVGVGRFFAFALWRDEAVRAERRGQ